MLFEIRYETNLNNRKCPYTKSKLKIKRDISRSK